MRLSASICLAFATALFMVTLGAGLAAEPVPPLVFLDTTYIQPSGGEIVVAAGGDFQAALDAAQPGDVITLEAGASFVGNFTLRSKTGTGWIYIRSSAHPNLPPPGARVNPLHASLMPKIVSPKHLPAIRTEAAAHHYRFIGIEITTTHSVVSTSHDNLIVLEAPGGQTAISQVPSDIIFDRSYIHGTPTGNVGRGIAMNSARTAVIDSYLSDFHHATSEAQAIAGWNGPGPFKIVNNYLEGAGENVMFGGSDPLIPDLVPSDIEIRHNHFSKRLSWKFVDADGDGIDDTDPTKIHWVVKSLFELRNAQRVLVEGNIFEHSWFASHLGYAILFTVRNQNGGAAWSVVQDVTFIKNIVRHASGGFIITGMDDHGSRSQRTKRLLIKDNLIEDLDAFKYGGTSCNRMFMLLNIPSTDPGVPGGILDLTIDHNTGRITGICFSAVFMGDARDDFNKHENFGFQNNLVDSRVSGSGTTEGTGTLDTFAKPGYIFVRNVLIGRPSFLYPPDNFFPATDAEVGFVDLAGGDYSLSLSSPYKNGGTDGKDIGADFDALLSAAGGVIEGTSPPPPDTTPPVISAVAVPLITSSGATITWATDEPADSQVEYGPTLSYGSSTGPSTPLVTSHSQTLSGLSAGTLYHYRAKSRDAAGNLAVSLDQTFTTLDTAPPDNTPPVRSDGSPFGALASGTTQTMLSLTTHENATCRYATTAGVDYASMPNTFATSGGTSHSATVAGLTGGTTHIYYVRCQDAGGNANSDDFTISFSVPAATGPPPAPVNWTSLVNVTVTGTTIKKSEGLDDTDDAGAISLQTITSGDGYVEFTAPSTDSSLAVGLSNGNPSTTWDEIDFAFYFSELSSLYITENGVVRWISAYAANDVFRVAVEGGVVRYYQNGVLRYTSAMAPIYPLLVDSSFLTLNASITNAVISAPSNMLRVTSVSLDPPTLHALGVQMLISGDENRSAKVAVRYRPVGSGQWREGPPLFRVFPETVSQTVPQQFAGSIFDLAPDTSYEIELHATDVDGPVDEVRLLTERTRPVPRSDPATPRRVSVDTASGLKSALANAQAGDVIEVAPEVASGSDTDGIYTGAPFVLNNSGTATNPIVIRGTSQTGVILDGLNCLDCRGVLEISGSFVHVENLTIRNAFRGIKYMVNELKNNVVRRLQIKNVIHGIDGGSGYRDFYICDNVIEGRLAWPWVFNADASTHGDDRGVAVHGDGHVVCHNRISGFGDPMINKKVLARSIDFYGNDILDSFDGMEFDFGGGNLRVFHNRWTNVWTAMSFQPVYGGPAYVMRNVVFNTVGTQLKFHPLLTGSGAEEPSGVLVYHNTFVSPQIALNLQTPNAAHNFVIMNNLFVGPRALSRRAVEWTGGIDRGEFDFNGYFPEGGFWMGKINGVNQVFANFAALSASGVFEESGTLLAEPIFAAGFVGPTDGTIRQDPPDFTLATSSNAKDGGIVLPGINQSFVGAAPDLGALESGCSTPAYGPRPTASEHLTPPIDCSNQAPAVNAGEDQTVTLPGSATLTGTAADDGQPNPPGVLTAAWSQVSGPGAVTFSNANALSTTASFSTSGLYVLRLTVSDGAIAASDDVTVTVNEAPAVNAGEGQTVTLPGAAALTGTAADDGQPNPPGALTPAWSQMSGPGAVTFSDASALSTTASFSNSGLYVLRLTVSDGAIAASDDVTITVNQAPDCALAQPSGSLLWPANHSLVAVSVVGVTDPNNDPVRVTITRVTQDEPVDGPNDGSTSPDAFVRGDTVDIRAERSDTGNGRVYQVHLTADDGRGGACSGLVAVGVPQTLEVPVVDDGQLYDSTSTLSQAGGPNETPLYTSHARVRAS